MTRSTLKVHEALERVQMAHPYTASGKIVRSPRTLSEAAALWARLLELDTATLDRALAGLTDHELRLLLFAAPDRFDDARAFDILDRLLIVGRVPHLGKVGWTVYVITNGRPGFREAALSYARSEPTRRVWIDLAEHASPLDRAVELYLQSGTTLEQWVELPGIALAGSSLVTKRLKARALGETYFLSTIARESPEVVVRWVNQVLTEEERVAWYYRFLNATYASSWNVTNEIMFAILSRFGDPDRSRPFWSEISDEVFSAVERWIRNVRLTRLLGEGERVDFWRRFLDHVRETFESRDQQAVFICFDDWFAVQYRDPGAATYIFADTYLNRLRRLAGYRLYRAVLRTPRIGRYEHRGYWQPTAEAVVRRVLRERKNHGT